MSESSPTVPGVGTSPASARSMLKVSVASSIGTMIDWYDFLLSALAASIVYPTVFFSFSTSPAIAFSLSIASYSLAFIVRPIGSFLFGHYGDRMGRKSTLILTLLTMGVGTLGIGITPSYAAIGFLAPVLLFVFRFFQGLGIGGEWGGAATWVSEFTSKSKWKAMWNSGMQAGLLVGFVLAVVLITVLRENLTSAAFLSWGWRIPFYVGAVIVLIGGILRYTTTESPVFNNLKTEGKVEKSPAIKSWRQMGGRIILLAIAWNFITMAFSFIWIPYSAIYAGTAKVSSETILMGELVASLVMIVTTFFGSYIADAFRVRRKYLLFAGAIGTAILTFPLFMAIDSGNSSLVILGMAAFMGADFIGYGVMSSLWSEQFPAEYRYSGSGQAYNIAAIVVGVLGAFLTPALISLYGIRGSMTWMSITYIVDALICAAVILMINEPKREKQTS